MYTFDLTSKYLTNKEQDAFADCLDFRGLDKSIWDEFDCLFKSKIKGTQPLLLKVYEDADLHGVAIIEKRSKYGKSLFSNSILSRLIDSVGIPVYLWVKFRCCMDMISNPGFVKTLKRKERLIRQYYFVKVIND